MRCNERTKFAARPERGLGARRSERCARATTRRPLENPAGIELHRAPDAAKDQSYVLQPYRGAARPHVLPAGRHAVQGPSPTRRPRRRGSRQSTSPTVTISASSRTAHLRVARRARPARSGARLPTARASSGSHEGRTRSPSARPVVRSSACRRPTASRARAEAPGLEHGRWSALARHSPRRDRGESAAFRRVAPSENARSRATRRSAPTPIRCSRTRCSRTASTSAAPAPAVRRRGSRHCGRALRRHARHRPVHDRPASVSAVPVEGRSIKPCSQTDERQNTGKGRAAPRPEPRRGARARRELPTEQILGARDAYYGRDARSSTTRLYDGWMHRLEAIERLYPGGPGTGIPYDAEQSAPPVEHVSSPSVEHFAERMPSSTTLARLPDELR